MLCPSFIAQNPKLISFAVSIESDIPRFTGAGSLQCLHVSDSLLSDDSFLSIVESRLPLRELRLPFCFGFSLAGLDLLLHAYPSLTDGSISLLASHLREVTTIDLSYCSKLTELTFMCLVKCCPSLRSSRWRGLILVEVIPSALRLCRTAKSAP
ncbi:hypothetical protein QJS04_geneDACA003774 [Acorus gramineus]|uniref:Uncharacterized protein n=1 Tax=Acorus gramineus TaxID=55184 RepID=A0AAV9BJ49_ACOGR|nr:hypothetical protein QJS04_geneDACA003774 [Acorus gramineus]